jgi:prefoldin beta subunit
MSKEMEQTMANIQMQNQQLQLIALQQQAMEVRKKEIELAEEALKNVKDKVFKIAGPVVIEKTKQEAEKELKEEKDDIELKLASLSAQEKKFRERLQENQKKLQG